MSYKTDRSKGGNPRFGPNRNGSQEDHVMASAAHTTPARLNPTWVPAPYPLGDLARFFNGRGNAPAIVSTVPARPAPAAELVAC
jgi:hypothetical protein